MMTFYSKLEIEIGLLDSSSNLFLNSSFLKFLRVFSLVSILRLKLLFDKSKIGNLDFEFISSQLFLLSDCG